MSWKEAKDKDRWRRRARRWLVKNYIIPDYKRGYTCKSSKDKIESLAILLEKVYDSPSA